MYTCTCYTNVYIGILRFENDEMDSFMSNIYTPMAFAFNEA